MLSLLCLENTVVMTLFIITLSHYHIVNVIITVQQQPQNLCCIAG